MAGRERTSLDDVFINCPFDDEYGPTFRALIFAVYACGFRVRSARELDDSGQTRIDKLYGLIEDCRYGIHDLSRTELDAANGLPRFNIPLELGIFLGAKRYGGPAQKLKRTLILDVEPYRYQRFIWPGWTSTTTAASHRAPFARPGTGWRTSHVARYRARIG